MIPVHEEWFDAGVGADYGIDDGNYADGVDVVVAAIVIAAAIVDVVAVVV